MAPSFAQEVAQKLEDAGPSKDSVAGPEEGPWQQKGKKQKAKPKEEPMKPAESRKKQSSGARVAAAGQPAPAKGQVVAPKLGLPSPPASLAGGVRPGAKAPTSANQSPIAAPAQSPAAPMSPSTAPAAAPTRALPTDEVKVRKDQVLAGEAAQELVCGICHGIVGCGPVVTKCSHLFCGDCIGQCFEKQQNPEGGQSWAQRAKSGQGGSSIPCPVSGMLLEEKDLFPISSSATRSGDKMLFRLLSSLKIVCCNHPQVAGADGKCNWVGEYSNYQAHIRVCQAAEPAADDTIELTDAVDATMSPSIESTTVTCSPSPSSVESPSSLCSSPRTTAVDSEGAKTGPRAFPAVKTENKEDEGQANRGRRLIASLEEVAMQNFEPNGPGMLAVKAGERLIVIERSKEGWALCRRASADVEESGWVPTWAAPMAPAPQHLPSVEVTLDYTATDESQVSLLAGDRVEIIKRDNSGWTFGRKASNPQAEGWFPEWVYGQQ